MSTEHRRRIIRRPTTLVGWIAFFVGGFILAGAGAALAYFLLTVIYATGNFALAQASKLSSPTAATVTENSSISLHVAWTGPAQQLTGAHYKVVRTASTQVCFVTSGASSCTVTGLTPGTHYSFSVTAVLGTNWQSASTSASFTTLGVTTTSLPNGTVGTAYTKQLSAIGGTGADTWSLHSGALPTGLSLTTSTGKIHGTPTTAGTTNGLVFRVTDSKTVFATSVSLSITVTKGSEGTTTSLILNHVTRTYGAETTETFSVTVTGQRSDGYPEGTVKVENASGTTTICIATLTALSETTDAATYKCSLTASQLTTGSYSVKAHYTGGNSSNTNYTYTASTSATTSLTINPATEASTTTLNTISTPKTFGSEGQTFTGKVSGSFGKPEGTVTVKATGSAISTCTTLSLSAGSGTTATFTCTLGTSALGAATHSIVATYTPGTPSSSTVIYNYSGSSSTPAQTLVVTKLSETSTTTLNTISTPKTFGSEGQTFTGKVSGSFGKPEGTVTVKATGSAISTCTTLSLTPGSSTTATFSCTLGTSALNAGTHSIVATYAPGTPSSSTGNHSYSTSSSGTRNLTVAKLIETTTTTLNAVTTPKTYGSEGQTLSGKVSGSFGKPEGTVTVKATGSAISTCTTLSLTPGSGNTATFTCTLGASALNAGSHSIVATYTPGSPSSTTGNHSYSTSSSTPAQTLVVTKLSETTSITTLTRSTASVAYGSETTETFTVVVTGSAGSGYPEGAVKVTKSTTAVLCTTSTITAHTATNRTSTYHCHLTPATKLAVGSYTGVQAKYTGGTSSTPNYSYNASATSSTTVSFSVTAASESTTISLTLSSSTTIYGSETTVTFHGTVTGQSGDGYPKGTVNVKTSTGTTLCSETLPAGTGVVSGYSCTTTNKKLTASGTAYTVKATYTPGTPSSSTTNYTYSTKTSSGQSLTVDEAPTITSAASASIFAGSKFAVTTTGEPTGASMHITNTSFTSPSTCTKSTLPTGLTFTTNANGTAAVAASTSLVAGGPYTFCVIATNGVAPAAHQKLTITIVAFSMTQVKTPSTATSFAASTTSSVTLSVKLNNADAYFVYAADTGATSPESATITSTAGPTTLITTNTLGDGKSKQWVWLLKATNSGNKKVTVTFTGTLAAGKKNVVDVIQLVGATLTTPISGHLNTAPSSASTSFTAAGNAGSGNAEALLFYEAAGSGTSAPTWTAGGPTFNNVKYTQAAGATGWGFQDGYLEPAVASATSSTLANSGFGGSIALTIKPDPPAPTGIQFVWAGGGTPATPLCTEAGTVTTCTVSNLNGSPLTGAIELYYHTYMGTPVWNTSGATLTVAPALTAGSGGSATTAAIATGSPSGTVTIVATGSQTWTYSVTIGGVIYTCNINVNRTVSSVPTVTKVTPPTGTTAGGTSVMITGTNFANTATVSFGSTTAASFVVNGPTSITAVSPPQTAGPVAVTVTTAKGTSATSTNDVFTYATPTPPTPSGPTVASLTPATGPGSTVVTITGTNLSTVMSVVFGTVPGTTLTVSSTGTTLTVKAPAGTVGTAVTVSLLPLSGTPAPAGKFTYTSAQSSTSSTPPKTPPATVTPPTGTGSGTG